MAGVEVPDPLAGEPRQPRGYDTIGSRVAELGFFALGALIGAVIGFVINELLGRGVRGLDRRRARRDPLMVHIETDPSIIWAGMPPWIGARFLVPPDADVRRRRFNALNGVCGHTVVAESTRL